MTEQQPTTTAAHEAAREQRLRDAKAEYKARMYESIWYNSIPESQMPVAETLTIRKAADNYVTALEAALAERTGQRDAAVALKDGRKGVVSPGVIRACYSIVCNNCRHWVTSYRSSAVFVAEDLELAGWVNDTSQGWICPDCAKAAANSSQQPSQPDDAGGAGSEG